MHGLTFALTLISAVVPAPSGVAAASSRPSAPAITLAQATTPPPATTTTTTTVTTTTEPPPSATAVSAAPGYAPSPMVAREAAPIHRGLSLWGILPYSYGGFGMGLGARFALPLPIPSLIPRGRIRDSWSLEFGADYFRYSLGYLGGPDYTVNWFVPVCGIMWNVWINDSFAVYPKAEAGYHFGWVSGYPNGLSSPGYGGVYADGAVGLIYKIGGAVTLRAEAGNIGFKGGVGFMF
jgi:hypothetical protein